MARELLTKQLAAQRLDMSVRRLMEISAEGQITRHRAIDPKTRREAVMFDAREVDQMKQAMNGRPVPLALPPGPPMSAALAAAAELEEDYDAPMRLWVTIAQAAEYTGLPASTITRLIDAGKLKALDVGVRPGGHWRVRKADLEAIEGERHRA